MVILAVSGCQSASSDVDQLPPTSHIPEVDSEFQSTVLADGDVTRAELEQAYARFFECLREGGGTGEVWLNLDLQSSYQLRLSVEGSTKEIDLETPLIQACEGSYLMNVEVAYAQAHPETAEQAAAKSELALNCLERESKLFGQVGSDWNYGDLRSWADEVVMQSNDPDEWQTIEFCVKDFGIPYRDLEDM